MKGKTLAGLAGFVILGLSPSYIDWQQEPAKRPQMVGFYVVAVTLIYWGVLKA